MYKYYNNTSYMLVIYALDVERSHICLLPNYFKCIFLIDNTYIMSHSGSAPLEVRTML